MRDDGHLIQLRMTNYEWRILYEQVGIEILSNGRKPRLMNGIQKTKSSFFGIRNWQSSMN